MNPAWLQELTPREQRGLLFLGIVTFGVFARPGFLANAAQTVGLAGLGRELWTYFQEAQTFANPEAMNSFFKSAGTISAVGSNPNPAAATRVAALGSR